MRKSISITAIAAGICLLALFVAGCGFTSGSHSETDYASAIMVDGAMYYLTVTEWTSEIDESSILGYTESYTDTFPRKDGETNFNQELDMPYAEVAGGIVVFCEDAWRLCTPEE